MGGNDGYVLGGGGEVVDSKKTPVVKSCIGGERVHVFVVVYVE